MFLKEFKFCLFFLTKHLVFLALFCLGTCPPLLALEGTPMQPDENSNSISVALVSNGSGKLLQLGRYFIYSTLRNVGLIKQFAYDATSGQYIGDKNFAVADTSTNSINVATAVREPGAAYLDLSNSTKETLCTSAVWDSSSGGRWWVACRSLNSSNKYVVHLLKVTTTGTINYYPTDIGGVGTTNNKHGFPGRQGSLLLDGTDLILVGYRGANVVSPSSSSSYRPFIAKFDTTSLPSNGSQWSNSGLTDFTDTGIDDNSSTGAFNYRALAVLKIGTNYYSVYTHLNNGGYRVGKFNTSLVAQTTGFFADITLPSGTFGATPTAFPTSLAYNSSNSTTLYIGGSARQNGSSPYYGVIAAINSTTGALVTSCDSDGFYIFQADGATYDTLVNEISSSCADQSLMVTGAYYTGTNYKAYTLRLDTTSNVCNIASSYGTGGIFKYIEGASDNYNMASTVDSTRYVVTGRQVVAGSNGVFRPGTYLRTFASCSSTTQSRYLQSCSGLNIPTTGNDSTTATPTATVTFTNGSTTSTYTASLSELTCSLGLGTKSGDTFTRVAGNSPATNQCWLDPARRFSCGSVTSSFTEGDVTNLSSTSSGTIKLSWTTVTGAASYKVVYGTASTPANCNSGTLVSGSSTLSGSTLTYDTGLMPFGSYYFRVCAVSSNSILAAGSNNSYLSAAPSCSSYVLGQSNFTTSTAGTSTTTMNTPRQPYSDGTRLFVMENTNNRVLMWNTIPTANGQAANLVLGHSNFTTSAANTFGVGAPTVSNPNGIHIDKTKLFLTDSTNNRVLVWNTIPTATGQAADFVLGQSSFTTNSSGTSATTLFAPKMVYSDGTKLYVSDTSNNRILVWNTIPTATGQAADFVLGQPNLTSNTANNGGISASTLSSSRGACSVGTKFFAADAGNNRVLAWNTIPTATGQAADFVLGQSSFTTSTSGTSATTLNTPSSIYSDGTKLFVTDSLNHRVLVWNTIPTATAQAADFVLGQSSFTTSTTGTSATALNNPSLISGDGTRLFVSESANHRVLVWNTMPTATAQAADFVLGQSSFTTKTTGTSATTMNTPRGVYTDGTKLHVSDSANNRILVWNTIPTATGQAADLVLGQGNFTTSGANTLGVSQYTLSTASYAHINGTKLFVVDCTNNRVLVWNTIPTANGQAADFVLGQSSFGTNTTGTSATTMNVTRAVYSVGTKLFVSDVTNNRILVWNTIPTATAQAADFALGQPDLTSGTANNGGISASTISGPRGINSDGTKLFVADNSNNRVLVWNTIPTASGQAADFVLGQTSFTTSTSGTSATTMNSPFDVYSIGTRLYVDDYGNNRVLVWNTIPTASGQAADYVLGQPDFTSNTINNGGISASRMNGPTGIVSDGTYLYVTDYSNNRVLMCTP